MNVCTTFCGTTNTAIPKIGKVLYTKQYYQFEAFEAPGDSIALSLTLTLECKPLHNDNVYRYNVDHVHHLSVGC